MDRTPGTKGVQTLFFSYSSTTGTSYYSDDVTHLSRRPKLKTVKKKATKKKAITKKKITTKKKSVKKLVKKSTIRTEVFLCSKVYNTMIKKNSNKRSAAYLLGEDKKQVVREMILLKKGGEGCGQMPGINSSSIASAYIELIKKKLIPSGLARVKNSFSSGARWHNGSGPALYQNVGYIISIDKENVIAEIFIPNKKQLLRVASYERQGKIVKLAVRLTDK